MAEEIKQTKQAEDKNFRYIVRIVNTDMDGNKPVKQALLKIKGIGFMFANMICNLAKIDKLKRVGTLSDAEIQKIEEVLKDPSEFGAPVWMFNRRRNPEDGADKHLLTTDLKFVQENDIKMMKKIRCRKGVRHMLGLPVRGQSTRSKFRKSKSKGGAKLGVQRRAGAKSGK